MQDVEGGGAFARATRAVLEHLARVLPMGSWMVTRRQGDRQIYLAVRDTQYGLVAGGSHAWDAAYCVRMVAGRGPLIAPRVADVPAYDAAPIGRRLTVGAYAGVPLVDGDTGELFGTLCAIDTEEQDEAVLAAEPTLRLLGSLLGEVLAAERRSEQLAAVARRHHEEAHRDGLTGVRNRRGWDVAVADARRACASLGEVGLVAFVDVDGLKAINDTQGHSAGDRVIRTVAEALRDVVRDSDVVARIGGDEFGLLVRDVGCDGAGGLLERVEERLAAVEVGASVGVAVMSLQAGVDDAPVRADEAMYARRRLQRTA